MATVVGGRAALRPRLVRLTVVEMIGVPVMVAALLLLQAEVGKRKSLRAGPTTRVGRGCHGGPRLFTQRVVMSVRRKTIEG